MSKKNFYKEGRKDSARETYVPSYERWRSYLDAEGMESNIKQNTTDQGTRRQEYDDGYDSGYASGRKSHVGESDERVLQPRGLSKGQVSLSNADLSTLDAAVESLRRTADMAEEALQERRTTLREMAIVEARIARTQAQSARMLQRLVKG